MALTNHQSRITNHYDVVIAGASFAGLTVAQRLRARASSERSRRVVLIDKDPLGGGQTSACGAPVSIVCAMGAAAAIQQIHDELIIHTPTSRAVWPLPEPFCTFDYRRFCELALACAGAEFVRATALGHSGSSVQTTIGDINGRFLVDATGWRAVLVGGPAIPYVNRRWMAFGIETEVACEFEPGLHFYFLPDVRDGYAWVFPCGKGVRFGVLSYPGRTKLGRALEGFVERFGLRSGQIHGGYLASGLRPPVVETIFVVGDASGQCLPLTGEGIRTAVRAGFKCGGLLQQVLDRELTLEEAARAYRTFIEGSRRRFRALLWGNIALLALPLPMIAALAGFLARPKPLRVLMTHYLGIFSEVEPRAWGFHTA